MPEDRIDPLTAGRVLELLPPFPIVLVTTRSNIITIGQIEYFTFTPLRIGIAVAHSRYSYGLLKEEGEFVVNVPDRSLVDAVKLCGSISGRDHDKFRAAGLEPERSMVVDAVGLSQCRAHVECRVEREIVFEERTWFVGKVVAARKEKGFLGDQALLCGRYAYTVPGPAIASR